jgi:hypothetical protein
MVIQSPAPLMEQRRYAVVRGRLGQLMGRRQPSWLAYGGFGRYAGSCFHSGGQCLPSREHQRAHGVARAVNPANAEPGPVVLSLGCDTNDRHVALPNGQRTPWLRLVPTLAGGGWPPDGRVFPGYTVSQVLAPCWPWQRSPRPAG